MYPKVLVISVKPEFAYRILSGEKTIELRKNTPSVTEGDLVIIYATQPVKAIVGYCKVSGIVKDNPSNIWDKYSEVTGISKQGFMSYYSNTLTAIGIKLKDVNPLSKNFTLKQVKAVIPKFKPPQSFAYLTLAEAISTYKHLS
ncbi:ASCH domain-containing protein [Fulvivirga sp.]|uniref:ASCH domain-containing protein n=1 Tax=Fulvivirga sp. TaxID=1931237 RepID=UPI0032ED7CA1